MKNKEYKYSIADFKGAIEDGLKDIIEGYKLKEFISDSICDELEKYVNLYRFYGRNCSGCAGCKDDCSFAYGSGNAKGAWDKARKGEIFDCPVRTNGTLSFSSDEGIKSIDISDRKEKPYEVIEIKK